MKNQLALALAFLLFTPISSAFAAEDPYAGLPNVSWKMSHTQAPDHHMNVCYESMAKYVKEKSGGRFIIDIYHSGTLGAEQEVIENMQMGTIAGNLAAAGLLANFVPCYEIFALPAVFADENKMAEFMADPEVEVRMRQACEEADIINYGYFQNFFWQVFTKKEVRNVADYTGQKIRVMGSAPFIATFQALGCNPTTTAWGELYSALQLGVCDGLSHIPGSVKASAFYENLSYVSNPKLFPSPMFVIVSKPMYDRLPEPYQELLDEAINNRLLPELRRNADGFNDEAMKFLLTEGGMTMIDCDVEAIHKVVAPIRDEFLSKMEPWVRDLAGKAMKK